MLRRLKASRAVCESHSRSLAAKARVGKATAAVEPRNVEVAIRAPKGVHLVVRIQVLVTGHGAALWLPVRGESGLVKRRADAWAGREGADLRRHSGMKMLDRGKLASWNSYLGRRLVYVRLALVYRIRAQGQSTELRNLVSEGLWFVSYKAPRLVVVGYPARWLIADGGRSC